MKRTVKVLDLPAGGKVQFDNDDLLHFARLVTIGELSACFGHEVTNPLMLIRGHLRFIEESLPPDHPLRSNLEVINRASRRIDEMAKNMLDFSKKRANRIEPCDITELVSDSLRFLEPYVRTQFIEVQTQLDPGLPRLRLDRWQMVQAIVNLLQNAAYAMTKLDCRVLSIAARVENERMLIAISDTVPGIPSGSIAKIFDPFFTTKGEHGTGLGLYITKQVIERHGGTIAVQTGHRGTTFVISLPV
jgi:two-component system, NtrC family, sensor kinase